MDWLLRFADPSIDWNYAMVTLVVRFIGVFVVMAIVQVALQSSSYVVHRIDARKMTSAQRPAAEIVSLDVSAIAEHQAGVDGAVVAAIAAALNLEEAGRRREKAAPAGRTSAWAMSGRMRSMR